MLDPTRLGIAGGIIGGVCMFLVTLFSLYTGYAAPLLTLLSSVYVGYKVSWIGSIIGLIYGFIDGFIKLYVLAWIYNKLGKTRI